MGKKKKGWKPNINETKNTSNENGVRKERLKQCEISHIVGVYDGIKLYLENSWGEPLEKNPFYIANNRLYDKYSQVDDETLGRLIRKDVVITATKQDGLAEGEEYFFINPNRKILRKENTFDVTDLMNLMIGNHFFSKESVNEKEVRRIMSIFSLIKGSKRNLFPYEVKEPDFVVSEIISLISQEKNKKRIVDNDEKEFGFLQKNFEQESLRDAPDNSIK